MRNEKKTQKCSGWQAGPGVGSREGGPGHGGSSGSSLSSSAWSTSAPGAVWHPGQCEERSPVFGHVRPLLMAKTLSTGDPPCPPPAELSAEQQRLQCCGPFLGEREINPHQAPTENEPVWGRKRDQSRDTPRAPGSGAGPDALVLRSFLLSWCLSVRLQTAPGSPAALAGGHPHLGPGHDPVLRDASAWAGTQHHRPLQCSLASRRHSIPRLSLCHKTPRGPRQPPRQLRPPFLASGHPDQHLPSPGTVWEKLGPAFQAASPASREGRGRRRGGWGPKGGGRDGGRWGGGAEEPGPSLLRGGRPCVRESVSVRHLGQALS